MACRRVRLRSDVRERVLEQFGVGCLPVARGERLVGIITLGDLMRSGLREEKLA